MTTAGIEYDATCIVLQTASPQNHQKKTAARVESKLLKSEEHILIASCTCTSSLHAFTLNSQTLAQPTK